MMRRLIFSLLMVIAAIMTFSSSAASPAVVELEAGAKLPEPSKGKAVVIDFNASWCMPCRMFKPAFDRAADEFGSKAVFVSVNIDECGEVAREFGVRSIPFVVVLREGKEPVSHLGAMTYDEFKEFLIKALR